MKLGALAIVVVVLTAAASASGAHSTASPRRSLVTDRADAQLVNPWGLAASREGPWWVSNEGRSTSTLYSGAGQKQALTVAVPGGPTGVVFNRGRGFVVRGNGQSGPARFIYACEDGDAARLDADRARGAGRGERSWRSTRVRRRALSGASRWRAGSCMRRTSTTDRVLVLDSKWRRVGRPGAFVDREKPAWYAPFGIQAAGDRIFVTYAYRAPVNGNDAPHGGYVDEFDLEGRLLAHVGRSGELDEPWGVALAPRGFGRFGGDLLVANFGSGGSTRTGGTGARGSSTASCPSPWRASGASRSAPAG
jgi:uncharacterized protein (TIGR03118 family)